MDQAGTLREMSEKGNLGKKNLRESSPRVLTFSSGKGGVGKTNISTNLAIVLARGGKKVMVLDADLGLANIDVVLGLSCKYNLSHVLANEMSLSDIIVDGPNGIMVLPSSSGIEELSQLNDEQKTALIMQLENFDVPLDFLFIDTSAGINTNVTYFNLAAHESIVIVTPEPTSITDAYALIKILSQNYHHKRFQILVNQAASKNDALDVYKNLTAVADRYLTVSMEYIGFLVSDPMVNKSVLRQQATVLNAPQCPFSKGIEQIAAQIQTLPVSMEHAGNPGFFWRRLLGAPIPQEA